MRWLPVLFIALCVAQFCVALDTEKHHRHHHRSRVHSRSHHRMHHHSRAFGSYYRDILQGVSLDYAKFAVCSGAMDYCDTSKDCRLVLHGDVLTGKLYNVAGGPTSQEWKDFAVIISKPDVPAASAVENQDFWKYYDVSSVTRNPYFTNCMPPLASKTNEAISCYLPKTKMPPPGKYRVSVQITHRVLVNDDNPGGGNDNGRGARGTLSNTFVFEGPTLYVTFTGTGKSTPTPPPAPVIPVTPVPGPEQRDSKPVCWVDKARSEVAYVEDTLGQCERASSSFFKQSLCAFLANDCIGKRSAKLPNYPCDTARDGDSKFMPSDTKRRCVCDDTGAIGFFSACRCIEPRKASSLQCAKSVDLPLAGKVST